MNYEERYNHALKIAKYYHDRDNIHFLEHIFPEPSESEDERIREELLDYLKCFIPPTDMDLVKKSKVWIAWLEKQGENKSSWSEEDEKRISRITDFIWKNRKGDTDEIYQQEQDVNWLKSIKPRWKPTEEQMEALNTAVAVFRGLQGTYPIKDIESLYNELKTLI